jgi:hypothetical protein
MADFVAVIRRAVDGLATNSPETRAKVYDKARGAVQRQLESMKPRPPEDMLRRQMDKLEAAIVEVESEHSEALPPEPEVAAVAPVSAPYPVEAVQEQQPVAPYETEQPVPAPEPVATEERAEERVEDPQPAELYAAPERVSEPAYEQPEPAPTYPEDEWRSATTDEPRHQVEQEKWREPEPVAEPVEPHWHEPEPAEVPGAVEEETAVHAAEETASGRFGDWRDDLPEEPQPAAAQPVEPAVQDDHHGSGQEAYAATAPQAEQGHVHLDEAAYRAPVEEQPEPQATVEAEALQEWRHHDQDMVQQDQQPAAADAPAEPWTWPEGQSEPVDAAVDQQADDGNRAAAAWDDVDDLIAPAQAAPAGSRVEAHFDQEMHVSAAEVRMPQVSDLPHADQQPAPLEAEDIFEPYVNPSQTAAAASPKQDERDPWSDLEDLIGYTKEAPTPSGAGKSQAAPQTEDDFSDLLSPPAKPYRVTAKRKRNYTGIILGLVALLLLGGAVYALWINRDSVNDMVSGLVQSGASGEETAEQATQQPEAAPQPDAAPATTQTPESTAAPAATQTTPPAADGASAASKFTQRLMQDGTEVDAGPGEAGALAQNAEGQSVAQLNAPPANPTTGSAPAGSEGAAGATAAPNAPATPTTTPSETPAASGEKMFLYEERIGQSAPTAIEGTVSWSLQREPGQEGGPAEAVIQGRITIPGRGLTALLTVKRNSDSSLPASHLIEIVFAVPPDFEGGAIDSVLRIAMKQTEQDRGNALVAVPAKITDDFHMVALNDFPDARATNLELLRSRDWLDIPVAYRNGRRALFTLQKGPEGRSAFEEAIREWTQNGGGAPTGQ